MKVNFIIIGAGKCGTTTLATILASHPEVSFSKVKEPRFFCTSPDWRKGLSEYEKLFDGNGKVYGEASTTYTCLPTFNMEIWNDIYEYNSNMKFIYMIRNPIDRIISHYMHAFQRGYTNLSIEEAIKKIPIFMDCTRYYTQISPFIEKFGRQSVLIILFEDFMQDRATQLRVVSEFLDIDPDLFMGSESVHDNKTVGGNKAFVGAARYTRLLRVLKKVSPRIHSYILYPPKRVFHERPKLSLKTRRTLIHILRLEIGSISKVIGRDLSHWLDDGIRE